MQKRVSENHADKESIMTQHSTKTHQYRDCTIRIHRPILTDKERTEREKRLQEELTAAMTQILTRKEKTA